MYSRQVSSFREKLNSRILRPAGAGRGSGLPRLGSQPTRLPPSLGLGTLAAPQHCQGSAWWGGWAGL